MTAHPQFNKILVALDGSLPAYNASKMAIQISHSQNWTIEGLYVVDALIVLGQASYTPADLGNVATPCLPDQILSAFERRGDQECRWLEEHCRAAGVPVETHMMMGGIKEMIEEKAEHVGMIALGRCGNGHASDANHLGENFQAIAHHTRVPLLVGGAAQRSLHRLLLTYDGSPQASRALSWAVRLQQAMSCEVSVVFVQENHEQDLYRTEAIQAELDQSGLSGYRFLERRGQPAEGIIAAADETRADLIVKGGDRPNALLEWLTGSTLDLVLQGSPLAMLVA